MVAYIFDLFSLICSCLMHVSSANLEVLLVGTSLDVSELAAPLVVG